MTDFAKKIAQKKYDEASVATTASTNRHGLSRTARKVKRTKNRAARRAADRAALSESKTEKP